MAGKCQPGPKSPSSVAFSCGSTPPPAPKRNRLQIGRNRLHDGMQIEKTVGAKMTGMTVKTVGATLLAANSAFALAQGSATGSAVERASAAELEEVVVTAQKAGDQQLHTVPLAIQVFSAEELKEKNINTIDDLVSNIPGAFEGFRQTTASRIYNIRGAV